MATDNRYVVPGSLASRKFSCTFYNK